MRLHFTEQLNVQKCKNVLNLSKGDMKDIFWDGEAVIEKGQWKENEYIAYIKKFLREVVQTNGLIDREYRFQGSIPQGRIYVKGGGLQPIQHKLRAYIAGEYYYDFDMVNAHPRLLFWACKKYGFTAPILYDYINRRSEILADHNLRKKDILIAINMDNPRKKRDNQWFNLFISELKSIKVQLHAAVRKDFQFEDTNTKNPLSSIINKYLCYLENEILQQAIEFFGEYAQVPVFDGVMVSKDFCTEEELPAKISELNYLFEHDYDGLVVFVQKPIECNIVLPEVEDGPRSYEDTKVGFEEDYFLTMQPYAFWHKSKNSDGSFSFNQMSESAFRNACKEYKIIAFRPDDKMYITNIFDTWMSDPHKRKYQCVDFVPYGREDTCPSFVFNTFDGFQVTKKDLYVTVPTDNFDTLLFNLCGEDVEATDFLTKYIAHMFQYPARRTEKIIVFISWTGCGKDTLFRTIQRLMGAKYCDTTGNVDELFGNFNDLLDSKLCLFMNEMDGKDGIAVQERIKEFCTREENRINRKHQQVHKQNNFTRLFVNSNNDGCVNVQVSDRRYWIVKAAMTLCANVADQEKRAGVTEFWDRYYNNLRSFDWQRSLYERLMSMDLTDFDPSKPPNSKEKAIMKEKNIPPIYYFLRDMMDDKDFVQEEFITHSVHGKTLHLIRWGNFMANFKSYVQSKFQNDYKIKDATIKQKIKTADPHFNASRRLIANGKTERYASFSFEEIKKFFANHVFNDTDDYNDDIIMDEMPREPGRGLAPLFSTTDCL